MVSRVRRGRSQRAVAKEFGVSVSTVSLWCARSAGARLDRFDFEGKRPGRASNRTAAAMERRVVRLRRRLREHSVLGEYGGQAIGRALRAAVN
jgi:transposase